MARTEPFTEHTAAYDSWFDEFESAYESEVSALQALRPEGGDGLEVGVGTGRFAAPLGIDVGLDPAPAMLEHATERGITPVIGVAESLPFRSGSFDLVLLVTTICFVEDLGQTLREARRVLDSDGHVLLGYIDAESRVGRHYQAIKDENPFYKEATFYSTDEVLDSLERAGFGEPEVRQTIFQMPTEMTDVDPVREGYGEGSFVALRADSS